ncbi:peptidoglycan D,D-transpeptidase FtsI family protein [Enterococcus nangangensis]|uniref:peptidoglycan D,D-transpeptidase FtsI family protein n=1 Tax=Enterococcus nangangensis TaxID=2559926 RepID=UPI0010F4A1A1|nr:penicillin-binding protein 2 [Enterococcus nangangensis]
MASNWFKKQNASPNKKNGYKSHIPFRLNFLFFIIFAAFLAMIGQLAYVQIIHGDTFTAMITASTEKTVTKSTPRGMIYDTNGKVLVGNTGLPAITYTKGSGTSAAQMRTVAQNLAKLINVPEDAALKERDKKDFFLADDDNYQMVLKRVPQAELKDEHGDNLSSGAVYAKVVDQVTAEEINFSAEDIEATTLFTRMNGAYALTTIYLKSENVSNEELAVVAENASYLPGVSTGTDWERSYPYGSTVRSILGTVSTEKTGLPSESADQLVAMGYSLNDRVGTSYLEQQYEFVLQGIKAQNKVTVDTQGDITNQVETFTGAKGDNIVSTIDIDFQQKVEAILKEKYTDMIAKKLTTYSDGVYAVVMNPNTGDVISLAGFQHDLVTNELTDNPLGTINSVFVPGSSIKGATITAGYQNGILNGNQTFIDQPLQFQGTATKSSIFNRTIGNKINMDVIRALGESSNVFMMHIALGLMGTTYTPNMSLPNDLTVFNKLRSVYEQFGLGSSTGIDVPKYSTGLVTPTQNFLSSDGSTILPGTMGLALDLSFGNYDSYTAMQLAQYVSTIATSGKRYAARLVKGVYGNDADGNLGSVLENFNPTLLNTVDLTAEQWDIIHQGFYATTHQSYGTATAGMSGSKYDIAGKTGTAETYYYPGDGTQHETVNNSFVGYAPADNPEVAVAVILPHIDSGTGSYHQQIAKAIFDTYYDMYANK